MKIGYTGWTWDVDEHRDFAPINEFHRENFEQFLREISDLGYETAEHFCFIADAFDFDARRFRQTVDAYGVEFANLYFFFADDAKADAENVKKYIAFAQAVGATHMNLQAVMWKEQSLIRPTDRERVLAYANLADQIGGLCRWPASKPACTLMPILAYLPRSRSTCSSPTPTRVAYPYAWIRRTSRWRGWMWQRLRANTANA
jgi:hypothetical protein